MVTIVVCCCVQLPSHNCLCHHMNCSMPGFLILHCLPEFAQTQVLWVSDAIQLSYPHLPPLPSLCISQHQGLFQWISSSHQVAKVLELQLQSSQWIFRIDFLQDWLVWSPFCSRNSQESSLAPQFESISSSALSLLYTPTLISIEWCRWVIQPSQTLSSPSLPALNLSQHHSFPMSWLFISGGQSTGTSASVLPMNIQSWFPLGLTGLIALQSKGLSIIFHDKWKLYEI